MTSALFQQSPPIFNRSAKAALTGETSTRSTGHMHHHITLTTSHTSPSAVDPSET